MLTKGRRKQHKHRQNRARDKERQIQREREREREREKKQNRVMVPIQAQRRSSAWRMRMRRRSAVGSSCANVRFSPNSRISINLAPQLQCGRREISGELRKLIQGSHCCRWAGPEVRYSQFTLGVMTPRLAFPAHTTRPLQHLTTIELLFHKFLRFHCPA